MVGVGMAYGWLDWLMVGVGLAYGWLVLPMVGWTGLWSSPTINRNIILPSKCLLAVRFGIYGLDFYIYPALRRGNLSRVHLYRSISYQIVLCV
jgi:hypothetical protein